MNELGLNLTVLLGNTVGSIVGGIVGEYALSTGLDTVLLGVLLGKQLLLDTTLAVARRLRILAVRCRVKPMRWRETSVRANRSTGTSKA